jgi:hypothetical protein
LFAVIKGALVFAGTVVFSWITLVVVQRIPFGARLLGATPEAVVKLTVPSPADIYARIRQLVSQ